MSAKKRIGILLLGILLVGGLLLFSGVINHTEGRALNASSVTSAHAGDYKIVTKNSDAVFEGDLILVNGENEYRFPKKNRLIQAMKSKNSAYQVKNKTVLLEQAMTKPLNRMMADFAAESSSNEVTIISGHRTLDYQKKVIAEKAEKVGEENVDAWAARPGFSEHHTGMAMDFGITRKSGKTEGFTGDGKFQWLADNAHRYGFIVRYPASKVSITKISNEPWHFRFVGKPHAYLMKQKEQCLEEYIDFLRDYSFEKQHLIVTDDENQKYEIYFVKADDGTTSISVPKDHSYTLSGNNVDGFIVTETLARGIQKST